MGLRIDHTDDSTKTRRPAAYVNIYSIQLFPHEGRAHVVLDYWETQAVSLDPSAKPFINRLGVTYEDIPADNEGNGANPIYTTFFGLAALQADGMDTYAAAYLCVKANVAAFSAAVDVFESGQTPPSL